MDINDAVGTVKVLVKMSSMMGTAASFLTWMAS